MTVALEIKAWLGRGYNIIMATTSDPQHKEIHVEARMHECNVQSSGEKVIVVIITVNE